MGETEPDATQTSTKDFYMTERILESVLRAAYWTWSAILSHNQRLTCFLEGVALSALDGDGLRRLTIRWYEKSDPEAWDPDDGLKRWEEPWFAADLPRAPARLLVGAAGKGRETKVLAERGYDVVAFDPVEAFVKIGGRTPSVRFFTGSYHDLIDPASAGARRFCLAVESAAPFDAVLLGLGSFSHLLSEKERVDLLARCRSFCPAGPVLASFLLTETEDSRATSRARMLGLALGQTLTGRSVKSRERDSVDYHTGFSHSFTPQEIHEVAGLAGYSVARLEPQRQGVLPHATFLPR
jgi:hypothetical protein